MSSTKLNDNDNMFLVNGYLAEGAGESLVISAADFENFLEPRIVLSDKMEEELEPIITLLEKIAGLLEYMQPMANRSTVC